MTRIFTNGGTQTIDLSLYTQHGGFGHEICFVTKRALNRQLHDFQAITAQHLKEAQRDRYFGESIFWGEPISERGKRVAQRTQRTPRLKV